MSLAQLSHSLFQTMPVLDFKTKSFQPTVYWTEDNLAEIEKYKLWLSFAKLKLSYVEVKFEVVVKVWEEVVVETRVQLLVRRVVGGWVVGGWSDKTKLMLNSAFN